MNAAKVDSKGRISLPREIHEALGSSTGDTLFFNINSANHTVEIAKAINPFDILAAEAWAEFERGETTDLRDFAEEMGINLDER
ncbi:MAG: AbrB/MazE/SpoVT family DNA-binding domain-containing protein [Thermomicrobiales bacterium]